MKIHTYPAFLSLAVFIFSVSSCKKEDVQSASGTSSANPVKLGLYEADSSIYKLLFMAVPKIGTQTINQYLIYDTGSGGMVIDAHELIPASMITGSGFNFTGDSTVVNGITITNQTSSIEYGADKNTTETVYGNLAYANVTIGDHNGTITVNRLPFFLYYKGVDNSGNLLENGSFDIFGVNAEYDVTFSSGAYVTSPFSYYEPGAGLIKGFKMAALGTGNFSSAGTYAADVITLGLTDADVSASSGFTLHSLTAYAGYGYSMVVPGSITYGSKKVSSAYMIFDTGTEPYSYLQDNSAGSSATLLAANTAVSANTSNNFTYNYQVSNTENLTYVENPSSSGSSVSVISLSYFLNNAYLLDFAHHQLGLKNN